MICLIDSGFRINNALNILVNQCKYPGINKEWFCLGCSKELRSSFANKDNVNDNVNDLRSSFANNDNVNDLRSSFANIINGNDNDKDNDSVKDNVNDKDNVLRSSFTNNDNDDDNVNDNDLRSSFANNANDNDNDNVNDNDLRSSFANNANDNVNDLRNSFANNDNDNDNVSDLRSSFANNDDVIDNDNANDNDNVIDNFLYLFDEKHQRCKPNNKECLSNNISVNIIGDLQSWLSDDNIITEKTLPENFRCIISVPR